MSEELSILEICYLRPIMRDPVLEELRVRRLADNISKTARDSSKSYSYNGRLSSSLRLTYVVSDDFGRPLNVTSAILKPSIVA